MYTSLYCLGVYINICLKAEHPVSQQEQSNSTNYSVLWRLLFIIWRRHFIRWAEMNKLN